MTALLTDLKNQEVLKSLNSLRFKIALYNLLCNLYFIQAKRTYGAFVSLNIIETNEKKIHFLLFSIKKDKIERNTIILSFEPVFKRFIYGLWKFIKDNDIQMLLEYYNKDFDKFKDEMLLALKEKELVTEKILYFEEQYDFLKEARDTEQENEHLIIGA
jgi:hypothetical protein